MKTPNKLSSVFILYFLYIFIFISIVMHLGLEFFGNQNCIYIGIINISKLFLPYFFRFVVSFLCSVFSVPSFRSNESNFSSFFYFFIFLFVSQNFLILLFFTVKCKSSSLWIVVYSIFQLWLFLQQTETSGINRSDGSGST